VCLGEPQGNLCLRQFSDSGVETNDQELWDEILKQHELSMDQGSSPSWLTYGWRYTEADTPIDYAGSSKTPHKKTAANLKRAKDLLELIGTGLSQRKAAKQLGIAEKTARYILQTHRAHSACVTNSTQVEGNE
jgi:hypothetical protein